MQGRTKQELYQAFIDFIGQDIQRERHLVNRRMFSVFLWCFILPALVSATLLVLVKFQVLPRSARGYVEWVALVFPVFYSLYVLGSEVLIQIPLAVRRGAIATTLSQSSQEGEWRSRVEADLKKSLNTSAENWRWIITSFQMDLELIRDRTRYLTALAGAVFYLIMQGIDFLGDEGTKVTWVKSPMGFIESSATDSSQFIGLALFLVLFYLSGSQTHRTLVRYRNCAELILQDMQKGT